MAKRMPFTLVYAPVVRLHLNAIDAKYDSLIREKIEETVALRARHQDPEQKAGKTTGCVSGGVGIAIRTRQPISPFYQIDRDKREVRIVAVEIKDRDRLLVGGEEVSL